MVIVIALISRTRFNHCIKRRPIPVIVNAAIHAIIQVI